jgi:hypothetical protein
MRMIAPAAIVAAGRTGRKSFRVNCGIFTGLAQGLGVGR